MSEQLESTKYMRDLRRVIVQHFDLEEANLRWANLQGTNLHEAAKVNRLGTFIVQV
jgi:hypothetical protein